MQSNVFEKTAADVLARVLGGGSETTFVVSPTASTAEQLIDALDRTDAGTVHLVAEERTLKDLLDDFLVASTAADLVESGELEIRSHPTEGNTLVIDESAVWSIVEAGGQVAGLGTREGAFVDAANELYSDIWADATPYELRTPAMSRVRQTLEEQLGTETARDFETVLDSLETARGNGEGLDEVTVSLLVAARNQELLYDVSKWGEETGVASKATFSRTKTRLEELGLVTTEKVPIDVGRPRLRLLPGDDRLREVDATELASVASSMIEGKA